MERTNSRSPDVVLSALGPILRAARPARSVRRRRVARFRGTRSGTGVVQDPTGRSSPRPQGGETPDYG